MKHIKHMNDLFLNSKDDEEIVSLLKSSNLEAGFCIMFHFEVIILKRFGLPIVKWGSYLPDPLISVFNNHPWDLSTNLPLAHPNPTFLHKYGHDFILNRILINALGNVINILFNHIAFPKSIYTSQ